MNGNTSQSGQPQNSKPPTTYKYKHVDVSSWSAGAAYNYYAALARLQGKKF